MDVGCVIKVLVNEQQEVLAPGSGVIPNPDAGVDHRTNAFFGHEILQNQRFNNRFRPFRWQLVTFKYVGS